MKLKVAAMMKPANAVCGREAVTKSRHIAALIAKPSRSSHEVSSQFCCSEAG